MGRPINKRRFGKLPDANDPTFYPLTGDTFFNLRVNVQIGSAAESTVGYILAQKGTNRFLVTDATAVADEDIVASTKYAIQTVGNTVWSALGVQGDAYVNKVFTSSAAGTGLTTTGVVALAGVCKLVDKADGSLAANEMSIMGQVAATGAQVRIKKMYNRTCRDFNNVRYKWAIQDDSTATLLVLTAV